MAPIAGSTELEISGAPPKKASRPAFEDVIVVVVVDVYVCTGGLGAAGGVVDPELSVVVVAVVLLPESVDPYRFLCPPLKAAYVVSYVGVNSIL